MGKEGWFTLGVVGALIAGSYFALRDDDTLKEKPAITREFIKESRGPNVLSNGMAIPSNRIKSRTQEGGLIKYIIDTGLGDTPLEIFDENDGRPYHFVEEGRLTLKEGKLVGEERRKKFELTYKFCEKHDPFPIWDPIGFRRDPCYGLTLENTQDSSEKK